MAGRDEKGGGGIPTLIGTLLAALYVLIQFEPIRDALLQFLQGGVGLMNITVLLIVALLVLILASAIRIVREYERGVIFRLGRLIGAKGPGLFFLIPIVDKMVKVSLRVVTLDIPPQEVITKDNVTAQVNAVVFFRVVDPNASVVEVEDYYQATNQISQTTLRSVLGQVELDELLAEREKLNKRLQEIIDEHTDPWGIKVKAVEIKDVRIPQEMQRAIAKQAEAERERRAKVINALGELQASEKLAQAAEVLQKQPASIQLRFLQTLLDITSEQTTTVVFPIPIDILRPFIAAEDRARVTE
jgi:regulator of protease activity HflC (stomatin/prohibitin superfamily)